MNIKLCVLLVLNKNIKCYMFMIIKFIIKGWMKNLFLWIVVNFC